MPTKVRTIKRKKPKKLPHRFTKTELDRIQKENAKVVNRARKRVVRAPATVPLAKPRRTSAQRLDRKFNKAIKREEKLLKIRKPKKFKSLPGLGSVLKTRAKRVAREKKQDRKFARAVKRDEKIIKKDDRKFSRAVKKDDKKMRRAAKPKKFKSLPGLKSILKTRAKRVAKPKRKRKIAGLAGLEKILRKRHPKKKPAGLEGLEKILRTDVGFSRRLT